MTRLGQRAPASEITSSEVTEMRSHPSAVETTATELVDVLVGVVTFNPCGEVRDTCPAGIVIFSFDRHGDRERVSPLGWPGHDHGVFWFAPAFGAAQLNPLRHHVSCSAR